MINCLICQKSDQVNFLSEYLLEIKEDHEFFKDAKIYRCNLAILLLSTQCLMRKN